MTDKIKNNTIYWLRKLVDYAVMAAIVLIGFYYTTKYKLENQEIRLKNLELNTIKYDSFQEYVKRIDNLILSQKELVLAIREGDIKRIESIENEIMLLREEIRNLGRHVGYSMRSNYTSEKINKQNKNETEPQKLE